MNFVSSLRSLLLMLVLCGCPLTAAAIDMVVYYHNDTAGSPVAASDGNGNLAWREHYRPYGERVTQQAAGNNQLWFHNKPQDEQTGLSYFGARYYDPVVGRFMGVDPQGFDEDNLHSFNRYGYGNNNPYKFRDPDGRLAQVIFGILAVAYVAYEMHPMSMPQVPFNSGAAVPTVGPLDAVGGAAAGVRLTQAGANVAKSTVESTVARVRHHTSPEALASIQQKGVINVSRGGGVHVETQPFGPAPTASKETGAFGRGGYVEFDVPRGVVPTNVGPRNTGVIPTTAPLPLRGANPDFVRPSWWKFWGD